MTESIAGKSEYFPCCASALKTNFMELKSGTETVKGLSPSPTAGIGSTKQERRTHVPRRETSNVRIRTTPLRTSTLVVTKHATVELSTSIYQASSIANYWNNGRSSLRKLVSRPESKGTVVSLFYNTKPTATGASIIPASSSIYQPTFQDSSARHRQGIAMYILVMNILNRVCLLKYCLLSE